MNSIPKVGWVGHINSENDKFYVQQLTKRKFVPRDRVDDFIDLINNRDFLREKRKYDIVVVCYIFAVRAQAGQRELVRNKARGKWRVSDLSTPTNWQKRLKSTNANRIILIGNMCDIAPYFLGSLPEYTLKTRKFKESLDTCNVFSVYDKICI